MKKIYKLLLLALACTVSAQNYRFVYEYKMKSDIDHKDSLVTDYMNLDSDGKKSYFYNAVKYERDSVYQADKNLKVLFKSKNYDRSLSYIIEKDYSKREANLYDKYKTANLVITDSEVPKWSVEKEFLNINGMNCQKAVARYKGREWEAWFSKDYPISDGPYKFNGLPGIVVRIKDIDNEHVFNMIQVKKVNSIFSFVPKNNKKMSDKEYRKLLKDDIFSPEDIESINIDGQTGKMGVQLKDGYATQLDMSLIKKAGKGNEDAELGRLLKKSNNPIEKETAD
ncbi:GLPGLI family protein [Chryseobacterium sp. BIGb0232]|uniref:GLPGLI family protein n=1 Tax=Chryseobacterium sp. BIGb0232 TaxID=2940598 RepID=UPI000F4A7897|nr:GLPGLI family protein [Chryseobacterium sp. BIGb0232]MCS4303975.1 GLPGLI family protein [Chryseobacterium sp. BIGb0232]ROS17558.1 GLPGLI family protein [Chryseobacterium nakagawai]